MRKTKKTASSTRRSTWKRSKDSTSSTSKVWEPTNSNGNNKSRTGSSHRRPVWNRSSSRRCQPLTMVVHQAKLTSPPSMNVSASKLNLVEVTRTHPNVSSYQRLPPIRSQNQVMGKTSHQLGQEGRRKHEMLYRR